MYPIIDISAGRLQYLHTNVLIYTRVTSILCCLHKKRSFASVAHTLITSQMFAAGDIILLPYICVRMLTWEVNRTHSYGNAPPGPAT